MKTQGVYVTLLHGRQCPREALHDWGFDGPIIGPVTVGFIYGDFTLFSMDGCKSEELKINDGLVELGGLCYGDMAFDSEPPSGRDADRLIDIDEFIRLSQPDKEDNDGAP